MYRQGDVAIFPIDQFPGTPPQKGVKVKRDNGRIVLAYGEVTGHMHAIVSTKAEMWTIAGLDDNAKPGNDNDRLLLCLEEVNLLHEEHAEIQLPAGLYVVRRQREYGPDEVHTVID